MSEFFDTVGKVAIASRLRRLADTLTEDAKQVYDLYQVDLQPKWFPVFYILSQRENCSITEIANSIGQSHPSVSKIIKEMDAKGYIDYNKTAKDGRFNTVNLSENAKALLPKLSLQLEDVSLTIDEILNNTVHNLWLAMEDIEFELQEKSFLNRVVSNRKNRLSKEVQILDYTSEHKEDFKNLNLEWIETHFVVEPLDKETLETPKKKIIKPGGHIYMAQFNKKIVGTCALIKHSDGVFELSKMAVTAQAQGKNIGYKLALAIIKKAQSLGAQKIFLDSNTKLVAALRLYQKLGFTKVNGYVSPYVRSNIRMELIL